VFTILRPVFLMENLKSPIYQGAVANGALPLALTPDTPLQMIACEDIGALAFVSHAMHKQMIEKLQAGAA